MLIVIVVPLDEVAFGPLATSGTTFAQVSNL